MDTDDRSGAVGGMGSSTQASTGGDGAPAISATPACTQGPNQQPPKWEFPPQQCSLCSLHRIFDTRSSLNEHARHVQKLCMASIFLVGANAMSLSRAQRGRRGSRGRGWTGQQLHICLPLPIPGPSEFSCCDEGIAAADILGDGPCQAHPQLRMRVLTARLLPPPSFCGKPSSRQMATVQVGPSVLDTQTQNGDEPVGEYSFPGQSCLSSADS